PHPGRIDPISIALSMATMVPIVFAIKELAVHGVGSAAWAFAAAGAVFGVLFVRRQLRMRTPMLDMRLFHEGTFTGALLVNLLSVVGLVGFLFFVAQHLQLVLGLSPLEAGMALVPGLAAMIVAGFLVVPLGRRVAPRMLVPVALAFSVLGYVMVGVSGADALPATLVVAFVSLGIGIGAAETVSNELILASAPPAKAGAASAVSETAYELGAVLGTAVLGGVVTALYRSNLALPAALPADVREPARETLAGAMVEADLLGGALGAALRDAAASAFGAGVGVTAAMGAALVVVAAVIAAATLGGSRAPSRIEH
ncbi:MAG: MFS transporter, partial [Microbacterium sp.]|nr:MFS transporter [Microbacterium sp.]